MPDIHGKTYKVTRWRCSICHDLYRSEKRAEQCYNSHHPTTFEAEKGMWDH